jgi:hypothetical protein
MLAIYCLNNRALRQHIHSIPLQYIASLQTFVQDHHRVNQTQLGQESSGRCDELSQYRSGDATDKCETRSIGSSKYENLKLRKEEKLGAGGP